MTTASQAQQLLLQGRTAEAERAFAQILAANPDDVEALNVLSLIALRNGQSPRAIEMLQRAAGVNPLHAMTQHHLGLAFQAIGNLSLALQAQSAAVRAAPNLHLARLHLGQTLERLGRLDDAVIQYARALQDAQSAGRWLNADTTPAPLRQEIEHAVLLVRQRRRESFARLLGQIANRHGRSTLPRVEKCLRVYLNEETPVYKDPRQQPSFLFFPDLPTAPYFDRSLFPWIAELEAQTEAICDELISVMHGSEGRERVFTTNELEDHNLRGVNATPSWNGYYFYRHGERREANCIRCPRTAAALEALPLSRVPEHGPEVLFSVFTPGTHLLPHRGVTNTRVVGHLPLIVPNDCALTVGGEEHLWQKGRVVVFDDTYLHEAWNRSNQVRVVLIFDLWNPYLDEPERLAVRDLIRSIGEFRHALESA